MHMFDTLIFYHFITLDISKLFKLNSFSVLIVSLFDFWVFFDRGKMFLCQADPWKWLGPGKHHDSEKVN